MSSQTSPEELDAFNNIIGELSRFDEDTKARLMQTILTFLNIDVFGRPTPTWDTVPHPNGSNKTSVPRANVGFSEREDLGPKEFLLEKEPKLINDRVACLAYYLTHYRNTPHFKTLDISKLNTEAAQVKFTNASVAVNEAERRGLLVPAGKGKKQLSALAEQYVQALPDREAAKKILKRIKPIRKKAVPAKQEQASKSARSESTQE
ncbi:MAG: hypothetical protein KAU38_14980 [Desulfobacterales bacterium]|nr:hypothetical protein [Desulfobacterales bacterium]